jgi:hypothetical protein
MLVPIWEDRLPEKPDPEHTSMFFQLSPNLDVQNMLDELESYSSKVLIFLRRLRRIDLKIERSHNYKSNSSVAREDEPFDDGHHMTRLTFTDNSMKQFIVFEHSVHGLPAEERRPRVSQSVIQLAFPIDGAGQPVLESQHVYAFLPVRSYGFTVGGDGVAHFHSLGLLLTAK